MKKNNFKGFTLIEVLISMFILSILIVVFFNIVNHSIKVNKKNDVDIYAMHIAQTEMENLRVQIKKNKNSIIDLKNNQVILNQDNIYVSDEYNVKILIEEKSSMLYEINVTVEPINSNFSNKTTQIITQVVVGRVNES